MSEPPRSPTRGTVESACRRRRETRRALVALALALAIWRPRLAGPLPARRWQFESTTCQASRRCRRGEQPWHTLAAWSQRLARPARDGDEAAKACLAGSDTDADSDVDTDAGDLGGGAPRLPRPSVWFHEPENRARWGPQKRAPRNGAAGHSQGSCQTGGQVSRKIAAC